MPIDVSRCEAAARHLLRLTGWELALHCGALTVLGALHAEVCPRAPRLCKASGLPRPLRLQEPRSALPALAAWDLRHEIGHVGLYLTGAPWPHSEEEAQLVGAMVEMPRTATRQMALDRGLHPALLIPQWPTVLPTEVCARVALAVGGAALVYEGKGQRARLLAGDLPLSAEFAAYALASVVRSEGTPLVEVVRGVELSAAPFEEPTRKGSRKGVLVLVRGE